MSEYIDRVIGKAFSDTAFTGIVESAYSAVAYKGGAFTVELKPVASQSGVISQALHLLGGAGYLEDVKAVDEDTVRANSDYQVFEKSLATWGIVVEQIQVDHERYFPRVGPLCSGVHLRLVKA